MVLRLPDSWSNWNLEMLVFEERGKPEYPEKNLLEQGREPTTNSSHIWHRRRDLNPGYIGGRRVLSPLRHPCSPLFLDKTEAQRAEKFFFRDGPSHPYLWVRMTACPPHLKVWIQHCNIHFKVPAMYVFASLVS